MSCERYRFGSVALLATLALAGCGALITPQHRIETARREMSHGRWGRAAVELRIVVRSHPHNAEAWQLLAQLSLDAADLSGAQSALQHAIADGAKGRSLDALRVGIWLASGQGKAVLDAAAHHRLALGEPARTLAVAHAYLTLGKAKQTLETLKPLLAKQPDLTEAQVLTAQALAAQGRFGPALSELETAMKHDPSSPQPPLLKGRILQALGQYATAEHALVLALKRMKASQPAIDRINALVPLTEARLAQGEIDAAARSQTTLSHLVPGSPAAGLLAARIEIARGKLRRAASLLQRIVNEAPGYLEARMYLGAADLARGNLQEAQQALTEVVQQQPHNLAARKLLATVNLRLGQPRQALTVLTPVLSAQAADPQLLSLLGAAESRAGGSRQVLTALEGNLKADPNNATLRINLARAYLGAGRAKEAVNVLREGVSHSPQVLSLRIALAGALLRTRDFDGALKVLHAAKPTGARPALSFAIARVELAQGHVKQANVALDQAIAAHPTDAALVEDAGVLLLEASQNDAALARLVKATQLKPDSALYWLNAARAQLALNQPVAARASLEKASKIQPNWLPAQGILTLMDLRAKHGKAALARVDALLASQPSDAGALALKGYIEAQLGDSGAAIAAYSQAQKLHPTADVAVRLYQLGRAAHQGQPQKPLQRWLAHSPNDWRVHEVLGEYYLSVHSLHPATREFEAVLRVSPRNVLALNNLAWTYGKLGDARAQATAEQAYRLAPKLAPVDDTLGWILAQRHQLARAVPLLSRAVELDPTHLEFKYHYAYALLATGKRQAAQQILTQLLSTSQPFASRAEAERLLAKIKAT